VAPNHHHDRHPACDGPTVVVEDAVDGVGSSADAMLREATVVGTMEGGR